MSTTNNKSGLFVGMNKGKTVTLPAKQAWKSRPVLKKGRITKRVSAIRELIREIAGFSPMEKRMLEMLRTGVQAKEKKAVKHCRQKIGTHRRAQLKRDDLLRIIQASKRK